MWFVQQAQPSCAEVCCSRGQLNSWRQEVCLDSVPNLQQYKSTSSLHSKCNGVLCSRLYTKRDFLLGTQRKVTLKALLTS